MKHDMILTHRIKLSMLYAEQLFKMSDRYEKGTNLREILGRAYRDYNAVAFTHQEDFKIVTMKSRMK